MSKTGSKSIVVQIVDLLYSEGPMGVSDMCKTIQFPYKSVYTKALELRTMGFADKDEEGIWTLADGVTPQTLETGELENLGAADPGEDIEETPEETPGGGKKTAPMSRSTGIPLDQKNLFTQELKNVGVTPVAAIPTIANIFFSGDIDDLIWLEQVLKREAAGFVTPHQRRLIFSWWSHTRGLPYQEDQFFPDSEEDPKGKTAREKAAAREKLPAKPIDLGQGWKVGKDKDGDWVPQPGGPLVYEDALEAAERRALISSYGGSEAGDDEGGEEQAEGEPGSRKKTVKQESMMERMLMKMFDVMLDGNKGSGDAASETVLRLTERIETMEKERNDERMERLEGMVAQALSRDPWDDYDRINAMKERLGGGTSVVTDNSPAVQLIKDTTDKMDKNVNRMVGLFERTMLRSEEFNPETIRTAKQREDTAGKLLNEVEDRTRSRQLRRETFNV